MSGRQKRNAFAVISKPKIVPLQMELIQAKHPEVEAKQLTRCPKGTHRNKKRANAIQINKCVSK
jgi:hypothetical protein